MSGSFNLPEMLRKAWYGLAAWRTLRPTRKKNAPVSTEGLRRTTGVVESVRENSFITLRGTGRGHPVTICVRYKVDGTAYSKKETIYTGRRVPVEGEHVTVMFPEGRPEKASLVIRGAEIPRR